MQERLCGLADRVRAQIQQGACEPARFRAILTSVPGQARDAWVDRVFGLVPPPDDGPELPRGCVPYLPCSVDVLLRLTEQAPVRASDVCVDVGTTPLLECQNTREGAQEIAVRGCTAFSRVTTLHWEPMLTAAIEPPDTS